MANYLITGGAGFIGSNIVEHLLDIGESVRVLDNLATGRRSNLAPFLDKIDLIEGDISDAETCRRASDGMHSLAQIARARETLAYEVFVDFDEGVKRTVAR